MAAEHLLAARARRELVVVVEAIETMMINTLLVMLLQCKGDAP